MPIKESTWACPERSLVKHEILINYLNAWFPILAKHHGRVIYIDGFAGPGRYKDGEPGSPIRAIEAALNQRQHLTDSDVIFQFVEEDTKRAQMLRENLEEIALPNNFKWDVETGNFEAAITPLLDDLDRRNAKNAPLFAFIDPFGFSDVSFNLLRRLMGRDQVEVFVYFARNSINRFLNVDKVEHHMISLFGTDKINIPQGVNRMIYLKDLYESQLKTIAKYVGSFTMVNGRGVPNYDLFFASNHPLGYVKMKEAMWRVDDSGHFKYVENKHPEQAVLFQYDPLEKLERMIVDRGNHRKDIEVQQINEYIRNSTIYLTTHLKTVLKRLEANGHIVVQPMKIDKTKRRANTFPDGVIIDFV